MLELESAMQLVSLSSEEEPTRDPILHSTETPSKVNIRENKLALTLNQRVSNVFQPVLCEPTSNLVDVKPKRSPFGWINEKRV